MMNNTSAATDNPPPPEDNAERHTLSPESELRIEKPDGVSVSVTLKRGSAEVSQ